MKMKDSGPIFTGRKTPEADVLFWCDHHQKRHFDRFCKKKQIGKNGNFAGAWVVLGGELYFCQKKSFSYTPPQPSADPLNLTLWTPGVFERGGLKSLLFFYAKFFSNARMDCSGLQNFSQKISFFYSSHWDRNWLSTACPCPWLVFTCFCSFAIYVFLLLDVWHFCTLNHNSLGFFHLT